MPPGVPIPTKIEARHLSAVLPPLSRRSPQAVPAAGQHFQHGFSCVEPMTARVL